MGKGHIKKLERIGDDGRQPYAVLGNLDDGNYIRVNSTGHMDFVGDATVWDDLRVPMTSTRLGGSKDPDFAKVLDNGSGSQGLFTFLFDKTTEEELYFAVQFPHSRKSGSDIRPHVHWMPTGTHTGNVVWGLEYSWANINATFGASTIITVTDAGSGTADDHLMALFDSITGTGKTSSSMMLCRIFRQAGAGTDTYDEDAALIEVDFHYEIDKLGEDSLG